MPPVATTWAEFVGLASSSIGSADQQFTNSQRRYAARTR